jgi:hypothetical protein
LEDGPQDATSPTEVAARARDASGRFAKTATGEPIVGKPRPTAVEAPDGEPTIPEPPGAEKPFTFAGRDFKTQAEAEHWAKSMEGRYKPKEAEAAAKHAELVKASESARGWHGEAQRLQARIAELEAGAAQTAPQAEAPSQGIDWDLYAEINRVATEAGTPHKAQQWLMEQYEAIRQADIRALREEAIENPRREAEAWAQTEQTANTLVASMQAHQNPDGSPAFPELHDGKTVEEIGQLCQSMGIDPQFVLTPAGMVAAVGLYRMARSMNTPLPAAPAPPVPPDLAASAAAGLDGGRPLMPAAASRRELDPSVARIVAGLKNHELTRPRLGFAE